MVAASTLMMQAEAVSAIIAFGGGAGGRAICSFWPVYAFAVDVDV